jgi:hypothetical protein
MNPCQETSGFLFPHPCGRPGVLRCTRCGKFICMQHARPQAGEQFLCVTCARLAASTADTDTDSGGSGGDWGDDDDPYFYSSRYRARAGGTEPDPKDFTEGDQAALDEDEGGDFEDDQGAS